MGKGRTLDEWRALWESAVSATGTGQWDTDIDYPGTADAVPWGVLRRPGIGEDAQVRAAGHSEFEEVTVLLAAVLEDLPRLLDGAGFDAARVADLDEVARRNGREVMRLQGRVAELAQLESFVSAELYRAQTIIREAYALHPTSIGALLERSGMELPEGPRRVHTLTFREAQGAIPAWWRCSTCNEWVGDGSLTHDEAAVAHEGAQS